MQADDDQLVIRTGDATAALLARAVTPVSARRCLVTFDDAVTGFSVHTCAGLSVEQLARYARYPDARISVPTVRQLVASGLQLLLTPLGPAGDPLGADPLHATVLLDRPPAAETLQRAASAFAVKIANRFPRAAWTHGRDTLRDESAVPPNRAEAGGR